MEIRDEQGTIVGVRDADRIKRYTLVARTPPNGKPDGVRRFSLARVGDTPRSAMRGDRMDRLERMERIVEAERDGSPAEDERQRDQDMRS